MTQARSHQVSLDETPFYHCYVRCVRRAFLCGDDRQSGNNFDHRKQWIVSRLRFLSYIYAIDICAYAVMSNHYHVVLHIDQKRAEGWSDDEVVERWTQLYSAPVLIERWLKGRAAMTDAELLAVDEIIAEWRSRLFDIGWFMRGVNETIARMANAEEKVKGRFWEGRFRSQALLDEAALLSCMAYVDLNPVRAAMAEDLVESDFTSIQQRLMEYAGQQPPRSKAETKLNEGRQPLVEPATAKALKAKQKQQQQMVHELDLEELPSAALHPLSGSSHSDLSHALPFTLEDYFDLVDATGRAIRDDKRGHIPDHLKPMIVRLGINPDSWLDHIRHFGRRYSHRAGAVETLRRCAERLEQAWCKGVGLKIGGNNCYLPYPLFD